MKLLCKLFGNKWTERRYMEGLFENGFKTLPYKKMFEM
ncbi:DUF1660 domain-containing protein [Lactococcus lactis]|nr:DUF1660 domain-containing protein [Lactococcus lactis]